jgi:catechol 2,3-dioxygenase-like lactoylglutathione lyase family enzyme
MSSITSAIIASVVTVSGFDHLVLVVADVERTLAWYVDELGIPGERVEEWRRGEVFFPSLRLSPTSVIDIVQGDRAAASAGRPNVDHFCLVIEDDPASLVASGRFEVLEGPVPRWGAQGDAMSVYIRDPDGNVVELRRYPTP